jgi:hypothetical protein
VVFTLPCRLAPLTLQNKKVIYDLLFRTSAETLLEVARDGELLPTCLRRLARAIEGHNPATEKHDGSKSRKPRGGYPYMDSIDPEKEQDIRTAAGVPKDKPLTKALVKTYDVGWKVGHSAGYETAEKNRRIANERESAAPPMAGPTPLPLPMPSLAAQVNAAIAPFSPSALPEPVVAEPHEVDQAKTPELPAPAEKSAVRWKTDEEDEKRDDLPAYTVRLHAKSITSMKAQLKKLGIEAVVEKITRAESRADRLAEAGGKVQNAKATVEELRDELQDWLNNLPENLQGGNKASELEEAVSALDDIATELDDIDFGGVQFPGMF